MATVSVVGSATRSLPPELGIAHLSVRLEGTDRAEVARAASVLHTGLTRDARRHVEQGAATSWTAGQVWTSTVDRFRGEHRPPERRAVATATVRVTFQEFGALGEWFAALAGTEGLELGGVEWELTEERRQEAEREVRREAILDARSRALAYAEALGFEGVELQSAEEPGAGHVGADIHYARAMVASGGAEAYDLQPEELEIEASIVARFSTR